MKPGVRVLTVLMLLAPSLYGDFKVSQSRDKVILDDGKEIIGIVVASGRKAVVLVVEDEEEEAKEVVIPREKVKSIEKGGFSPRTKAFTTDPENGVKIVTGEGFRDVPKPKKKNGKKGGNGKKQQAGKKQQPQKGGKAATKITPQMIRNLANKDPRIKAFVNMAGGAQKAAQLLNDPEQRNRLEEMARRMNVQIPKSF